MPIIKSISTLRNKTSEVTNICRKQDEPVFLTTNGEGSLVIMSINHYDRLRAQAGLFTKLRVAQEQSARGIKGITHEHMISRLRKRLHG